MGSALPCNKKSSIEEPLGSPLTLIQWDPSPKLPEKSFPPLCFRGQGEGLWCPLVKGRCLFQGDFRLWEEEAQEQEKKRTIRFFPRKVRSGPLCRPIVLSIFSVWFLPHHPEGPLSYLSLDSISGFWRPPPVGRDWNVSHTEAGNHFANLSNSSPFTSM